MFGSFWKPEETWENVGIMLMLDRFGQVTRFRIPSKQIRTVLFFLRENTFSVCSVCHCVTVLVRDVSRYIVVSGCFVRVLWCFSITIRDVQHTMPKAILAITQQSLGQRCRPPTVVDKTLSVLIM